VSEIEEAFESFDFMIAELENSQCYLNGGCLVFNKKKDLLEIVTSKDDYFLENKSDERVPLLYLDTYFKYLDQKYIKELFKIINWNKVSERLAAAKNDEWRN